MTITDALAVKSLAEGLELFGLDPGVWLLIAEVGAFLVALATIGKKGYKAFRTTAKTVYAWAYPPAPPPPELDPMVQDMVNTIRTYTGEWAPNKNGSGGVYQTGNITAELNKDWQPDKLDVGGEDAKQILTGPEISVVARELQDAVGRSVEDKRRQNRERVRHNLHPIDLMPPGCAVHRIPLSTTAKVPIGEPKRIIT